MAYVLTGLGRARVMRRRGFGQGPSAQQVAGTVYGAGTGIAAPVAGGALASAAGISASLAIPIVGAAFAGIWLGIEAILNSGCGQTCIVTSNWADQAEKLLQQNVSAYLALPAPRAQTAQTAYLANFDKVWAYLSQECSNPQLGSAGQRCISDRQSGSCKWKTSPGGWQSGGGSAACGWNYVSPGASGSGGTCWNWFVGYRDPIANDSCVAPDAQASTASGGLGLPSGGAGSLLLLGVAAVLIVWGLLE